MSTDLAIILAGGAGSRLLLLSEYRAKPAVPFGGIYRIIDFALSNCVNSGLHQVLVLSQYRPQSLWRHLDFGDPWGIGPFKGEMVILQPYVGNVESRWYEGNADAVCQNIHFIEERAPEAVLILAGDHIYKMDYRPLLDFHKQRNADLTVAVKKVRPEEVNKFGTCVLDKNRKITQFEEKPKSPRGNLASMGIYVFDPKTLCTCLIKDSQNTSSSHDFGRDIVPSLIERHAAYGYEFRGYWQDVGTIDSYFETNMALLRPRSPIDLDDARWPVRTRFDDLPPARLLSSSNVSESLICGGCIIDGTVESSIISPGVIVDTDAVVRNSIVLHRCTISGGAKVNLSIIDEDTVVGENAKIGYGIDFRPNLDHPGMMERGVTLIGKGSRIPPDSVIGRNCLVHAQDQTSRPLEVTSGESIT